MLYLLDKAKALINLSLCNTEHMVSLKRPLLNVSGIRSHQARWFDRTGGSDHIPKLTWKYHFELAFCIMQDFKLLFMLVGRKIKSEPRGSISVIDGLKYIIYPYIKLP
jgi:hypothetical protein